MGVELGGVGETLAAIVVTNEVSKHGGDSHDYSGEQCANCGTALTGPYCHACGQSGHIHRSLLHMFEELLHGLFHFDTKAWRTIPALIFKPGKLTKEYIEGKRTSYVSPLALFLFLIFLMFYVFSWTVNNSADKLMINTPETREELVKEITINETKLNELKKLDGQIANDAEADLEHRNEIRASVTEIRSLRDKLDLLDGKEKSKAELQAELKEVEQLANTIKHSLEQEQVRLASIKSAPQSAPDDRVKEIADSQAKVSSLRQELRFAEADVKYFLKKIAKVEKKEDKEKLKSDIKKNLKSNEADKAQTNLGAASISATSASSSAVTEVESDKGDMSELYDLPYVGNAIAHADKNRELTIYKMKKNAASLAFLLMPLSLPFLWLMFVFKRKFLMFDHAVFSLYSLSFMCILMTSISILSKLGFDGTAGMLFVFIPPIHMYKQLRYAYDLGRLATLWRTFALLLVAMISLSLYAAIITYLSA